MVGFLSRLRRGGTAASGRDRDVASFRQAVLAYPLHRAPHPGFAGDITASQAAENLDWFLTTRTDRLADLADLMGQWDVPVRPAAPTVDATDAWVSALIGWTRTCWPDEPWRPEHLDDDHRMHAPWSGEDAMFSVTLDLATALGDAAIACRPEWHWDVSSDTGDLRASMPHSRRVVLTTDPMGPQRVAPLEDLEALVVERYRSPRHFLFSGPPEQDAWRVHLHDACTGRVIGMYRV